MAGGSSASHAAARQAKQGQAAADPGNLCSTRTAPVRHDYSSWPAQALRCHPPINREPHLQASMRLGASYLSASWNTCGPGAKKKQKKDDALTRAG